MSIKKDAKKHISEETKCVEETPVSSTETGEVNDTKATTETVEVSETTAVQEIDTAEENASVETSRAEDSDTAEEIEFPTMRDGTDITRYDYVERRILSKTSLEELERLSSAYEAFQFFDEALSSDEPLQIISGDYRFPENEFHIFTGFIIQVRQSEWNGEKFGYLDILIGNDEVKTIRFRPSLLGDKISKAFRENVGCFYTLNDLYGLPVRFLIENRLDEENNVRFSKIINFGVLSEKGISLLLKAANDFIE